MTISSADFDNGGAIPVDAIYPRCGGKNIAPDLSWSAAPASAKSFVLTMIDEDVKPDQWSHWIVVDLPPTVRGLARGAATLPGGARAVTSNFGDASYDGPCPPKDSGTHHYKFTIWALPDGSPAIAPDAKATDVTKQLTQMAVDHASITGTVTP
jgi:Raf kinase inhibitor-like YbhB/YbcL family protein